MTELLATQQIGFPILSLMILLPLLAAAGLYATQSVAQQQRIALGAAGLGLLLGLLAVIVYSPGEAAIQLAQQAQWLPALGASFHLGVDGVSVLFLPLTALVILLAIISGSTSGPKASRWFWANLLMLQAAAIGVYTALDLVLFFLFWELMLIPSYFLIRMWGVGTERQSTAMKYVLYMLMGSVPLLVAIAALGANFGTFDLVALQSVEIPAGMQSMLVALLFIAFAVKAPLPPFHTWLPSVAMEGPAGIAIFLVGLKMGTFGMIKVLLPLVPDAVLSWQPVLIWYGVIAMLYAGVIALAQTNMRKLLAYASVSHVGLVVAGIFSMTAAGLQGSVMAMVNFALASTVLMLLAGAIHKRLGTTELTGLGGLARHAPVMATGFFIAGLASIGMPGTSGFLGEFALLSGIFQAGYWAGIFALIGVILGAGYVLWFYERAFFGPAKTDDVRKMRDLTKNERWGVGTVLALVLVAGLAPMFVVPTVSTTTDELAQSLDLRAVQTQTASVEGSE